MDDAESMAEAGRRLNRCGASIKEAKAAFMKLSEAAEKVPFPDFAEIRNFRLLRMKKDHGIFRFVMPEYYSWLMMK